MEDKLEANTFIMFPMAQTIELTPGEVYRGSIAIVNPQEAENDFIYAAEVAPYGVLDDYEADLSTESDASMIVDWMTIDNPSGVVAPGETREVKFRIKVPSEAPGGGQYAAITVRGRSKDAEEEGAIIKSTVEMASVVYAEIEGEIVHEGVMLENIVPGFATTTPVKVVAKLKNDGNVHESATIEITVKNAWTGEVIFPVGDDDNQYNEIVMPGTTRMATHNVERLASLGAYEITQSVEYMGETYTKTQVVMICPIWFMLLVLATIASAMWTVWLFVRRRKHQEQIF